MLAGPGILFSNTIGNCLLGGETEEAKLTAQVNHEFYVGAVQDMLKLKPEERIITLPLTADETNAIEESETVIKAYWREAAANFVTGVWDIDEYWDTYLNELDKMGLDELVATYQTAYDRTK